MLLRDKLLERMRATAGTPDYVRLAEDVLGIRNAPVALARRLVEQALVVEDRREAWIRAGERIVAEAPAVPGVYLLRDGSGRVLYVGKANNIRRRLQTHVAPRRWRVLKPELARVVAAEWLVVGSEIEALVREAIWIRDLAPSANVQVRLPVLGTRAIPDAVRRDTLLVLPSADAAAVELLGVRLAGGVMLLRAARSGAGLAARIKSVRAFFATGTAEGMSEDAGPFEGLAPLVFSWLAGRGASATRLDPHDAASALELQRRVKLILDDDRLFAERIVVLRSGFRSTVARALSSVG